MKVFVKILRGKGWISDERLRIAMAPVIARDGSLEDLIRVLLTQKLLSPNQIEELKKELNQYYALSGKHREAYDEGTATIEELSHRMAKEIEAEKEKEKEKMEQKKTQMELQVSPLKIFVQEIRKQGWCKDEVLKAILEEIISKEGSPKDFLETMVQRRILDISQQAYLMVHAKEKIKEIREKRMPKVKDELSELEKSLGGEVKIQSKTKPPKFTELFSKPEQKTSKDDFFRKPHSKNVRILSDEAENMGFLDKLSNDNEDDEFEKNTFF
ncbi:MAG: hypothetical protein D6785_06580 [Planctomycetota bacterium]|nr:MAG: hypothetical protein D6785_06580 [Planctomycetota bacterium]